MYSLAQANRPSVGGALGKFRATFYKTRLGGGRLALLMGVFSISIARIRLVEIPHIKTTARLNYYRQVRPYYFSSRLEDTPMGGQHSSNDRRKDWKLRGSVGQAIEIGQNRGFAEAADFMFNAAIPNQVAIRLLADIEIGPDSNRWKR
jgi:hypothetical protein